MLGACWGRMRCDPACSVNVVHIVIMGCGRVGSNLATALDRLGRSVSVIDQDPEAFRRLGEKYAGNTVRGVGFDRDALIHAGIERAGAFAAVSSGDNSNIIAARVARETFNVSNVVARIYDPRRAEVYERLGIPTVATVAWTTGQILRRVDPDGAAEEWRDSTGTLVLVELPYATSWIGYPVDSITSSTGARVAYVTRYGRAMLIDSTTVLQEGDLLHVLCHPEDKRLLSEIAATSPGGN